MNKMNYDRCVCDDAISSTYTMSILYFIGYFSVGVVTVEAFLNEKESLFNRFYDILGVLEDKAEANADGATTAAAGEMEAAREDLEKIRETFRTRAKSTWDTVMSQEMTLVTQTEQVLKLCEQSLQEMISNFLNNIRSLFQVR